VGLSQPNPAFTREDFLTSKDVEVPVPRPLDVLPIRVSPTGDVEVIDIQYKAGKAEQLQIA